MRKITEWISPQSLRLPATVVGLLLLCLSLARAAEAQVSSVYEVKDDDSTLYLVGSIHLLRQSDYPLPPQFEQAYSEADIIYFETDIAALNDMTLQAAMMEQLTYQDGRTLESVLNDQAYEALSDYAATAGMPMAMLETFKPGLLFSMLSVIELQKLGFTPQGVDMYFNTRAMGDGKPTGQMESVQDQIDMLEAMGEGNESEFVLYALEDLEQSGEQVKTMVASWRSGDLDTLYDLFVEEMRTEAPLSYESMLVERNRNWVPVIERALDNEKDGTAMVVVGVAHLPGEEGLLTLLEERGYSVRPL